MYEIRNWTFNELDKKISEEIQKYLPGKMFDIHAHIYCLDKLGEQDNLYIEGPKEATIEVWRKKMGEIVGESRLAGGLFIPPPPSSVDYIDAANSFVIGELKKYPDKKGLILIPPDWKREKLEEHLLNRQIVGIKPFSTFSDYEPHWESPLRTFLPEWAWAAANDHGLIILVHLVRYKALADPENYKEIVNMCKKYPHARLLLDHTARGFHAPNTVEGVMHLRGLENVWFDFSCICEPAAIIAILEHFGPKKLMWGSDFPLSRLRGKSVTSGDGFFWLSPNNVDWTSYNKMCDPTLLGIESLRAAKEAFEQFGINNKDKDDIFFGNAARLLGYEEKKDNKTQELYKHAKTRIPAGTQLLSKRPENMAPGKWPPYFSEARGCEVWDLDGNHYYDMSTNGIGSCLLGFAHPEVNRAVRRRINLGSMSTLNPPEEVELADVLCCLHPWAHQARFARTGGEIAAIAVRIARATTKRSVIAVCGYHGWHDWYLAANLSENDPLQGHLLPGLDPIGVPRELMDTTVAFRFNNREEFSDICKNYGDRMAAVIMEPCRYNDPDEGFLEFVKEKTHGCGAVLIFDEITIGWRLCYGGSHLRYGVSPDMAIFAKALGNGYPIAAVIGTREAMEGANTSFISSTYWTEGIGPAAALKCIEEMSMTDIPLHINKVGDMVRDHWLEAAKNNNVDIDCRNGFGCLAHFSFIHKESEAIRTIYTQQMLKRGFLAGTMFYPTIAHTEDILCQYRDSNDEVFYIIGDAVKKDNIEEVIEGPIAKAGFTRLNE